ncbi:MAG: hypothetical protein SRB2_04318 [Desulfobacteraceae bacterium Eth-SRB2]|nr:MAG: hypothetical protein SRB2_04318 [Desulfobacteraceae bacterium Eth-SRB2]
MEVLYRKAFWKDLKNLKNQPVYERIFVFVFKTLPETILTDGNQS